MKCNRVWSVMRKPTKEEFKVIAQASGLGLLIIGLLGFLIALVFRLTPLGSLFEWKTPFLERLINALFPIILRSYCKKWYLLLK